MPVVEVYTQEQVDDETRKSLSVILPKVVANALNCKEGGGLTEDEICVRHRRGDFNLDRGGPPIQIMVFAHDYAERKVNLDERCEEIMTKLKEQLGELEPYLEYKAFIWIILAPTAFGNCVLFPSLLSPP
ncbi:MAG: hypothetical protein HYS87_03680 [Candidatus Colwellbacteria bacterium]|nr:hypothetical protein [Candidatus Colwellbacteria bacterium]